MPCSLCGARHTDPARGARPWKRGVRHERQVLICPECQLARDWKADLDRCPRCRSTFLLSRLGEVECHSCGHIRPQTSPCPAPDPDPALTNAVEQALSRALRGLSFLPADRTHH